MSWHVDSNVRLVVGILGNITALALFLSPAPTFWRIIKRRDVEDFRSLPYICTLLNCLLWTFYGLPFITKDAILVSTINMVGSVMQIMFLGLYIAFAPRQKKVVTALEMVGCIVGVGAVVGIAVAAFDGHNTSAFVGSFACAFAIIMYTSPLSIMRQVIQTKSVEFMPFYLSFAALLNALIWTAYAIYVVDVFVLVPNGIGVLLTTAQLVLYACYWKTTPKKSNVGRSLSQVPLNADKLKQKLSDVSGADDAPQEKLQSDSGLKGESL